MIAVILLLILMAFWFLGCLFQLPRGEGNANWVGWGTSGVIPFLVICLILYFIWPTNQAAAH